MEVKISISSKKGDLVKIKEIHRIDSPDKFEVKKIQNTTENSCIIKVKNNKMSLNQKKHYMEELPEISNKLINMGYSIEVIKYLFARYNFNSFDQAIMILGTDHETGKYNHFFYVSSEIDNKSNKQSKALCSICKDVLEKHEICYDNLIENTRTYESHFKLLNDFENSKDNDEVMQKLKNINNQVKIQKEFIEKLEKEFKCENLCIICYSNHLSADSSFSLECNHLFCKDCVKTYLEIKINEGNVGNLKCLQAGCQSVYTEKVFEKIVSKNIFPRFLINKNREETRNRLQNGFVPCTYPDCQELVLYKAGNNPLVFCNNKHRFCAICKEGWHKNTNCKDKNIQIVMRTSDKIRMCPKCNMFIEKEDGCNHITCEICNYEFCWLCLKKYEFYHYYVFNVSGCPGMRHAKTSESSVFENKYLNYLWYLIVMLLFILAIALLVVFFFLFGAAYEFVKCYKNSKNNKDTTNTNQTEIDDINAPNICTDLPSNSNNIREGLCSTWVEILIIIILIILGILLQPFFLLFKFLEMMMECYRNYGCLFFWFLWGNN